MTESFKERCKRNRTKPRWDDLRYCKLCGEEIPLPLDRAADDPLPWYCNACINEGLARAPREM